MVCEVELPDDAVVTIKLIHAQQGVQDHSLRCWISTEPGGSSISDAGPEMSFWHARRKVLFVHNLQSAQSAPENTEAFVYTIKAAPGTYYLNVLNLINSPNKFFIDVVAA